MPDTPEERVRQSLLAQMLGPLGYPKGLVAVERPILHGRRADVIVYDRTMNPLLLIECKALCGDEEVAFQQAIGYNASLLAPFWCVAHESGCRMFWREGELVRSVQFLPAFEQLVQRT